jgi:hypothetical protein
MSHFRSPIAVAFALLTLIACAKDNGTPVQVQDAKVDFHVKKLFTKDDCTVYRFRDGNDHYFTNCSGTTMTTQSYQCGKARCHRPEEITGK